MLFQPLLVIRSAFLALIKLTDFRHKKPCERSQKLLRKLHFLLLPFHNTFHKRTPHREPRSRVCLGLVEDGFVSPENNKNFETAVLLAALDGENDIEGYFSPLQKAYLKLTYSTDGTYSDMQKIERNIIWSGKCDEKDKLQNLPFRYEITHEIILAAMDGEEEVDDE